MTISSHVALKRLARYTASLPSIVAVGNKLYAVGEHAKLIKTRTFTRTTYALSEGAWREK